MVKCLRPLISLAMLAALAGPSLAQHSSSDVPFTTLAAEADSPISGQGDEVISSEARLRQVWDDVYRDAPEPPPCPVVDFSNRMVILLSMGQQPSGGSTITVTRVALGRDKTSGTPMLLVRSVEAHPGPNCVVSPALSCPIQIIEVPFHHVISFKRSSRTLSCK